jgi:ASC-1-like (ASCH) protein
MKDKEFQEVLQQRLKKIEQTLGQKAKEYAAEGDKLHNFNVGARMTGQIREKVLWGFALKHYISFMDILDDMELGKLPSEAMVDEKIGDLINYLVLVEASIKDKLNGELPQ